MVCEIALNKNFLFGFADSVYIFQFEGTGLVELFICCWTLAKIYFSTFIFDRLDAVAIIFAVVAVAVAVAVAIVFAVVAVAVGHLQIFHFFIVSIVQRNFQQSFALRQVFNANQSSLSAVFN